MTMALLRSRMPLVPETLILRRFASTTPTSSSPAIDSSKTSHHATQAHTHVYLAPNSFVGSWSPPRTPKEALDRLAALRRDHALQVKNLRKDYAAEVEAQRLDKQRKDEARLAAIRVENEKRRAEKVALAEVRAAERKVTDEKFRQTLLKERIENFENWKMKEMQRVEKEKEKKKLLREQSSQWIGEEELGKRVLEAFVNE